jgi:hypothetical protein
MHSHKTFVVKLIIELIASASSACIHLPTLSPICLLTEPSHVIPQQRPNMHNYTISKAGRVYVPGLSIYSIRQSSYNHIYHRIIGMGVLKGEHGLL